MTKNDLTDAAFQLLSTRPSGILSDIDGTLSRIVTDPGSATVEPAIKDALTRLAGAIDLVGVVSGRAVRDAERMLGLDGLVYLGNHGMEQLEHGQLTLAPEAAAYAQAVRRVLDAVRERIADPAVLCENKGVTASIHYRRAESPVTTRSAILDLVTPLASREHLRISHGRMVIELRPPVDLNKGTALRQIVEARGLRSILFLGDDVTDLDAMRALRTLRSEGRADGLAIGVAGDESPAAIQELADAIVEGVDGVGRLLAALAARFAQV